MKAIAFAIFYTVALSTYLSTVSFAEEAIPVEEAPRSHPVLLDTAALVLDRLA